MKVCKECNSKIHIARVTEWSDTFEEFVCVKCNLVYIYLMRPGEYKKARRAKMVDYFIEDFKDKFPRIKVYHIKKGKTKGVFIRGGIDLELIEDD